MPDSQKVRAASDNFVQQVPDYYDRRGNYYTIDPDVVTHNLQYMTPGELIWCANATEADLRARARMPTDRILPDGTEINPFWYHSPITA